MIKYVKDDLVKSDCDVIIHGCNCFCTMGAGIAKQIRETYPDAYKADKETVCGDKSKLGQISYVKVPNKYFPEKFIYIVNAYTQFTYGRKQGEIYADYTAIRKSMELINELFNDVNLKIGMPKIGAGLARGNWDVISDIINRVFAGRVVYVYEWDNGEARKEEFDLESLKKKWQEQMKERYE